MSIVLRTFMYNDWLVTLHAKWTCEHDDEQCTPDWVPYGHHYCKYTLYEYWEKP